MKRIYTKNNYLIIEMSGSAPLMRPKKDISFIRTNSDHEKYMIIDRYRQVPAGLDNVKWCDFVQENGEPFVSQAVFDEWITANTGNFNEGSDNGEFDPLNYDLADFNNTHDNHFVKSEEAAQMMREIIPEKGDKGEKGDRGEQGLPGKDGINGKDGLNGTNGIDGKNGIDGAKGEKGDTGAQGIQGIAGAKGEQGLQGIQGLKGDKGDTGAQGIQGVQGVAGVNSFGIPTLRTGIAKSTAYQALNPSKPAIITITLNATSNATLTVATNNSANILIGASNTVVTTGTVVGKYNNTLSVGVLVSTGIANTYTIALPANWFFAIVNTNNTTGVTIDTVTDQSVG